MVNLFKAKTSWFRDYNTPYPSGNVPIEKLLFGTKHRETIEMIRAIDDKNERDKLKATLPAFTPSCTCTYRSQSKVIQHSGLIQFDIDQKDNPQLCMPQLKEDLSKVPVIAFCGLSVSAKGLWGLIPIAYPERHKEHFEHIRRWFDSVGVVIDKAPSNIVSLRGLSYDVAAHVNHDAETLEQYYIQPPREYKQSFDANGETPIWVQYNETTDYENVLFDHGWKISQKKGNKTRYTRPNKGGGISAEFDREKGIFYVFTSSTQFEAGKGYSPFAVLAVLQHEGDFKKATKELAKNVMSSHPP